MTGYNCAETHLHPIPSNSDLTGPGVVANYVATAGLALLLILAYYFAIYDPEQDPFRKPYNQLFLSRPNPVDQLILHALRKIPRYIQCARNGHQFRPSIRYQRAFIKAVLTMSDIQLLTGLSILISGFSQLNQGLQFYYWLLIVYLAWFSTLTHLCCLTILRNYLYNHPRERIWRVASTGCLVILLLVSLSFSGNGVHVFEFTICHLKLVNERQNYSSYVGAITSMVLILFGFFSRLARLHEVVSVDFFGNARGWLSMRSQRVLRFVLAFCASETPGSLRRTIIYRPVLTIYLMGKAFLDLWSSMFWEIGWLLIAFVWGIYRLVGLLRMGSESSYGGLFEHDATSLNWGFGQVLAILLLLAPLVTLFQCFSHEDAHANLNGYPQSHSHELVLRSATINDHLLNRLIHTGSKTSGSPDNDWNNHSETLGAIVAFFISASGLTSGIICSYALDIRPMWAIPWALRDVTPSLLPIPIGLFEMILFSLMISSTFYRTSSWIQTLFHSFNVLIFLNGVFFTGFLGFSNTPSSRIVSWGTYLFLSSGAGAYILCAICLRVARR